MKFLSCTSPMNQEILDKVVTSNRPHHDKRALPGCSNSCCHCSATILVLSSMFDRYHRKKIHLKAALFPSSSSCHFAAQFEPFFHYSLRSVVGRVVSNAKLSQLLFMSGSTCGGGGRGALLARINYEAHPSTRANTKTDLGV